MLRSGQGLLAQSAVLLANDQGINDMGHRTSVSDKIDEADIEEMFWDSIRRKARTAADDAWLNELAELAKDRKPTYPRDVIARCVVPAVLRVVLQELKTKSKS